MLTYKALNTFIDDLFAFVIKMPMMYRIGCLRDGTAALVTACTQLARYFERNIKPPAVLSSTDVVFFIYLYQRWIYRVDPNRVNEFGTSGAEQMQDKKAVAEAAPAAAVANTDKPEGEKKND